MSLHFLDDTYVSVSGPGEVHESTYAVEVKDSVSILTVTGAKTKSNFVLLFQSNTVFTLYLPEAYERMLMARKSPREL